MTSPQVRLDRTTLEELPEEELSQAAPEPPRFSIRRASDLLAAPPPAWLVDGLLPAEGFACLYGAPGSGKSFVGLDLAGCVAANLASWFGHPLATEPGRPVVYVAGEGAFGLRARWAAWSERNSHQDAPLFVMDEPLSLLDLGAVTAFLGQLRATLPARPALVVLDTWSRCLPGGDENSAKDTSLALASVGLIQRETGGAVLALHHATKATERGSSARGSSALLGGVDVMLRLVADGPSLKLTSEKMRDAQEIRPIHLELVTAGAAAVVTAGSAAVSPELTPARRAVLACLADAGEPLSTTHWLEATQGLTIVSRATFYRLRNDLAELGLVEPTGPQHRARWRVTPTGLLERGARS